MGNLLSKAYNTGLASNSSSHESLKKDDGSPVEPHDTATTKVVDAKVDDDTVPSDPANVDELKSDPAAKVFKKDDGSPVEPHDTATTKVVDAKVDDDTVPSDLANVDELKSDPAAPTWLDHFEQQDIHRAYPVTPGYTRAVCDQANDERVRFPLVSQKTPGNLLLCGLWALAISITNHSDKTDRSELLLEQYFRYRDLQNILKGDEFKAAITKLLSENLYETTVGELTALNFFSADQMNQLLIAYAKLHDVFYRLAVLTDEGHFFANASESNADAPIIWVRNLNNTHWEGMLRPLFPEDESKDGKPLDLSDPSCRYDPRALGFIAKPVFYDFYDFSTMGPVTEQTELVPLKYELSKNRTFWDQTSIKTPFAAQLILAKGPLPVFKEDESYIWKGANLRFGIIKRSYAAAVRLRVEVRRGKDVDPIHIGYADFYFAPILRRTKSDEKPILGIKNWKQYPTDSGFGVEFQSEGGTPFNLRKPGDLHPKELSLIKAIYQLATTDEPVSVKLRIFHTNKELKVLDDNATATRLDAWFRCLPGGLEPLSTFASAYTYYPYRKSDGEPRTNWGDFTKRYQLIVKEAPMILASPLEMFSDPREAEIILGYGSYLEYHEEVVLLKQICDDSKGVKRIHKLRLVKVGSHIIACVELSFNTVLYAKGFKIPDRTVFKLKWMSGKSKIKLHSLAFTTDNQFSFPHASVVMILKGPKLLKRFGELAVTPKNVRDSAVYDVTMTLIENSETSKRKVRAVSELWAVKDTTDRRWWPVLLNQDHIPQMSNLFEDVDRDLYETAWKKIVTSPKGGFRWNIRQLGVFSGLTKLTERLLLISGPGGTGKSKLLSAIAFLCESVGFHIGMFTATDAAADHLAQVLYREYPSRGKPLRLYPRSREKDVTLLVAATEEDEAEWEEDLAMLEVVDALIKDEKERLYQLQEFSLQQHVLEEAAASKLIYMAKYVTTDDDNNVVPKNMEPVDMWKEFNRFHAKLKEYPYEKGSIDSAWEEEELNEFKQAYRFISHQIISLHKIIITTAVNFVSKAVSTHWALDAKRVVLMQDEAPLEKEATSYCPLTKGVWKAKVEAFIMCGDEKQFQPIVVSESGRNAVNEFRHQITMSLFERLRRRGFPVHHLIECHRQHATVSKLINGPVYNNTLITSPKRYNLLDPKIVPVLRKCLRLSNDEPVDEACLRTAYITVEGQVRYSSNTQSRANLENLEVVSGMLEILRTFYGPNMSKNVGLVTPYTEQVRQYKALFLSMRRKGWRGDELPTLTTIDGSPGREWNHVILDIVNINADSGALGFLRNNRRVNVALTRAKEILWIVGGALQGRLAESRRVAEYRPDANPATIEEFTPLILIAKKLLTDGNAIREFDVNEVSDVPFHLLSEEEILQRSGSEMITDQHSTAGNTGDPEGQTTDDSTNKTADEPSNKAATDFANESAADPTNQIDDDSDYKSAHSSEQNFSDDSKTISSDGSEGNPADDSEGNPADDSEGNPADGSEGNIIDHSWSGNDEFGENTTGQRW